jgi:type II secretory pathway component GspD/PulD (secretin)
MFPRILPPAGLAPTVLLLAGLISPAGAEQPCDRAAHGRPVTMTYSVADLVIPVDREPKRILAGPARAEQVKTKKGPTTPVPTREELLIKLIEDTIQPRSWSDHGGCGTIDYFPLTMSLVIDQTPDVQEQIADLLAALRRLQDQEVSLEVRFLSVPESLFCERIGMDFNNTGADGPKAITSRACPGELTPKEGEPKVLEDAQVVRLLEAIQEDARSNVMQAPKLTLFNGQRSTLCVGDDQSFVTGVEVRVKDGTATVTPKQETISSGIELSVRPVISADRRFVRIDLQALLTDIDTSVPLLPVSVPVVGKSGAEEAMPVTFTQYLQQPRVHKLSVEKTFAVPDGRTMVVDGGTRTRELRTEYGPPILSKIPYVSRLFRNVGYSRETERVLVLVTPRIISGEEEEQKKPASPQAAPAPRKCPFVELMKQFQAAYKEGKYEEAEKWALMAQELDPDNAVCAAALSLARSHRAAHADRPIGSCTAEESAAAPCPATKCRQEEVAVLLAKYHEACAAGRLDKARLLAAKALALDPACFSKPRR